MPKLTEKDWKSDMSNGIALILVILTTGTLAAVVILGAYANNAIILILAGIPLLVIAANGAEIFPYCGEPYTAIGVVFRFPGAWLHYRRRRVNKNA
jgi:hypothetical protein